jgi:hypothetical protein
MNPRICERDPIPPEVPFGHGHGRLWMTGRPFGQVPVIRPALSMDNFVIFMGISPYPVLFCTRFATCRGSPRTRP